MRRSLLVFAIGVGVGVVLGSRVGREACMRLVSKVRASGGPAHVHQVVEAAAEKVEGLAADLITDNVVNVVGSVG